MAKSKSKSKFRNLDNIDLFAAFGVESTPKAKTVKVEAVVNTKQNVNPKPSLQQDWEVMQQLVKGCSKVY